MMRTPRASFLIPIFNAQAFLHECLSSVQRQTFSDFEVICINDGSTDASGEILEQFANEDQRFRVFTTSNNGQVPSMNRGLELARSELICRLDADDICEPQRLQVQYEFLRQSPDVAMTGSAIRCFMDGGADLTVKFATSVARRDPRLQSANLFAHPAVTFRKEIVRRLGGYRSAFRLAEDYDLWLRMNDEHQLANSSEVLVHYRIHSSQLSVTQSEQQTLAFIGAQLSTKQRRAETPETIAPLSLVTRECLLRQGTSSRQIDRQIVDYQMHWLALLNHLKSSAVVQRPEVPQSIANPWRRYANSRLAIETAIHDWQSGHLLDCIKRTSYAFFTYPTLIRDVINALARRLRNT